MHSLAGWHGYLRVWRPLRHPPWLLEGFYSDLPRRRCHLRYWMPRLPEVVFCNTRNRLGSSNQHLRASGVLRGRKEGKSQSCRE